MTDLPTIVQTVPQTATGALTNFQKFEVLIILGAIGTLAGTLIFLGYETRNFWKHPGQSIGEGLGQVISGVLGSMPDFFTGLFGGLFK